MISEQISALFAQAKEAITQVQSLDELGALQALYLGKKSKLNDILLAMKNMDHEARIATGQLANKVKNELAALFLAKKVLLEHKYFEQLLQQEKIDVTLPGKRILGGTKHPLFGIVEQIKNIFKNLGYKVVMGQEIDNDEYNFQRLNLPQNHPARDMQDSFYFTDKLLLRTQCTNVTAHEISNIKDPLDSYAVVSVGNTYRRDTDDATHSHQFMQMDGFLIAPGVSFANLKWTIDYFCKKIFGEEIKMRMRPSYFPFTEPSVEVDITCIKCLGQGCAICKNSGWIEIMGAGMINPLVYRACGQPETLQGFAFGIGIERIAMLKYNIDDIRKFYTNDVRFLQQFKALLT